MDVFGELEADPTDPKPVYLSPKHRVRGCSRGAKSLVLVRWTDTSA